MSLPNYLAALGKLITCAAILLCVTGELYAQTTPYTCTNTTPPVITFVDSASAYGGYPYFASGSWLEIKGTNLADPSDPRLTSATNPGQWTSSDFNGVNAPTSLDGISVSVNGKPAYIWYLSVGQLNVQAPEDSAIGSVAITVTNCKATSSIFPFTRRALAPGLLAPSNYASGNTQYLAATFASDGAYVLNTSLAAAFGVNGRPAKPGDVIVAYGIGFGDVTPSILPGVIVEQSNALVNPVTISFGSTPATLSYSGLAGNFVGLYEFYINVPSGLPSGDYQINVTQNGLLLPQTFYLTVQNSSAPQVQTLTLAATSVAAGGTVQGTITLSAAAPNGGIVVGLSSNSSAASVPATVTVPSGATSATFTVSTGSVASNQTATITASYGGTSAQASLAVTPSTNNTTLPQFSVIIVTATFSVSKQTAFIGGATIAGNPSGTGYIDGGITGTQAYGAASPTAVTFATLFLTISVSGDTFTMTQLQTGANSFMTNSTGNYGITDGSVTITLAPSGSPGVGNVTGTFTLTSALETLTGTISGSYLAQ